MRAPLLRRTTFSNLSEQLSPRTGEERARGGCAVPMERYQSGAARWGGEERNGGQGPGSGRAPQQQWAPYTDPYSAPRSPGYQPWGAGQGQGRAPPGPMNARTRSPYRPEPMSRPPYKPEPMNHSPYGPEPRSRSQGPVSNRKRSPQGCSRDRSPGLNIQHSRNRSPQALVSGRNRSPQALVSGRNRSPQAFMSDRNPSPQAFMSGRNRSPQAFMSGMNRSPQALMSGRNRSPQGDTATKKHSHQDLISSSNWSSQDLVSSRNWSPQDVVSSRNRFTEDPVSSRNRSPEDLISRRSRSPLRWVPSRDSSSQDPIPYRNRSPFMSKTSNYSPQGFGRSMARSPEGVGHIRDCSLQEIGHSKGSLTYISSGRETSPQGMRRVTDYSSLGQTHGRDGSPQGLIRRERHSPYGIEPSMALSPYGSMTRNISPLMHDVDRSTCVSQARNDSPVGQKHGIQCSTLPRISGRSQSPYLFTQIQDTNRNDEVRSLFIPRSISPQRIWYGSSRSPYLPLSTNRSPERSPYEKQILDLLPYSSQSINQSSQSNTRQELPLGILSPYASVSMKPSVQDIELKRNELPYVAAKRHRSQSPLQSASQPTYVNSRKQSPYGIASSYSPVSIIPSLPVARNRNPSPYSSLTMDQPPYVAGKRHRSLSPSQPVSRPSHGTAMKQLLRGNQSPDSSLPSLWEKDDKRNLSTFLSSSKSQSSHSKVAPRSGSSYLSRSEKRRASSPPMSPYRPKDHRFCISVENIPRDLKKKDIKDAVHKEFVKYGLSSVQVNRYTKGHIALVFFDRKQSLEKALRSGRTRSLFGVQVTVSPLIMGEGDPERQLSVRYTRVLSLANIDKTVSLEALHSVCEDYGELLDIEMKVDRGPFAEAIVQYWDVENAAKAARGLNGEGIGNSPLVATTGKNKVSTCVWVDGLAKDLTDEYLIKRFSHFKKVVTVLFDRLIGSALILYPTTLAARQCVRSMGNTEATVAGHKVHVDFANDRAQLAFCRSMEQSGQDVGDFLLARLQMCV